MVDLCDCDFVEKVSWGEAMKLVPLCQILLLFVGKLARLSIAHVGYLTNDSFGEGPWKMEMPRFSVQVIKVGVQLNPGTPALVGTLSLPRGLQKHDETKRVWLAFLTVEKDLE